MMMAFRPSGACMKLEAAGALGMLLNNVSATELQLVKVTVKDVTRCLYKKLVISN